MYFANSLNNKVLIIYTFYTYKYNQCGNNVFLQIFFPDGKIKQNKKIITQYTQYLLSVREAFVQPTTDSPTGRLRRKGRVSLL